MNFGPIRHGVGQTGSSRLCGTPVDFDQEDRQMWESRRKNGRKPSRTFQPAVDGRLEDRVLLSSVKAQSDIRQEQLSSAAALLKHPNPRNGFLAKKPPQFTHNSPYFQGPGPCAEAGRRDWGADRQRRPGCASHRDGRVPLYDQVVVYFQHLGNQHRRRPSRTSWRNVTHHCHGAGRFAIRKLSAADRHSQGLPHVGRTGGYHRRRIDFQYRSNHQSAGRTSEEGVCPQLRVR